MRMINVDALLILFLLFSIVFLIITYNMKFRKLKDSFDKLAMENRSRINHIESMINSGTIVKEPSDYEKRIQSFQYKDLQEK